MPSSTSVLTEEQKKQLKEMPVPGFGPGRSRRPAARRTGWPPGGPGWSRRLRTRPGGGARSSAPIATPRTIPGLVGKDLKPGKTIEELQEPAKEPKASKDK